MSFRFHPCYLLIGLFAHCFCNKEMALEKGAVILAAAHALLLLSETYTPGDMNIPGR